MQEHKSEMEKFKKAIEVMNKAKNENNDLPKSNILYSEIEKINEIKEELIKKNKATQSLLKKYKNAEYNIHLNEISDKEKNKKNLNR